MPTGTLSERLEDILPELLSLLEKAIERSSAEGLPNNQLNQLHQLSRRVTELRDKVLGRDDVEGDRSAFAVLEAWRSLLRTDRDEFQARLQQVSELTDQSAIEADRQTQGRPLAEG